MTHFSLLGGYRRMGRGSRRRLRSYRLHLEPALREERARFRHERRQQRLARTVVVIPVGDYGRVQQIRKAVTA